MPIDSSDLVAVLRKCEKCGGNHTLIVGDQTSECPECDKNGMVIFGVDRRQFADAMWPEIQKLIRLHTGHQ